MTTDDDAREARAEVEALRAALDRFGLGAPVDGTDAADRRDPAQDDAAIAAILGVAGGPVGVAEPGGGARPDGDPTAAPGTTVVPLAARRTRRLRRAGLAVTSVAAAVLLAVGIATIPGRSPEVAVATGSPSMLAYPISPEDLAAGDGEPARDALLGLARTAAARVDPAPAGDVQHVLSESWLTSTTAGTVSTVEPTVTETWLGPDGSLVVLQWRGARLGTDGRLTTVGTSPADADVDRLPAGTVDPGLVAGLSLDPDLLRTQLLASVPGCAGSSDGDGAAAGGWCVYQAVSRLTDTWVLPSDLEAAIWTVLAEEPGVTLAGEVVDRSGRVSVAIAVPGAPNDLDPVVRLLLVDRDTGRTSGTEEVTLSSPTFGLDEPTVTQFRYTIASDRVAQQGGGRAG